MGKKQKNTSRRLWLIIIAFGVSLIFGVVENIKGVSFPLIKAEFGASYEQQGALVSLLSGGYVLFCLIAGIFLSRFGVKRSLLSGFLCIFLSLGLVSFMPSFPAVGAALFPAYAAFGFFEVGVNALGAQVFTKRAALLMSLLHFFYGAGAIIGPLAAGFLTSKAAFSWRHIYLLAIPLNLLIFVPGLIVRFPKQGNGEGTAQAQPQAARTEQTTFFGAFKIPMVWAFSVTLGLMEVVEMSSANWGGLYFQDVYGLDPRTDGAAFVSNFYILFTLSRLVSGFGIEKIGYMRSLFIACIATAVAYALGFVMGVNGIWTLPILGFFIAVMWPTIMAVAMGYFGSQSPVITSAIIVLSGAINAVTQLVIGFTNRYIGPAWGYRSCFLYSLLLIAALTFLHRSMRSVRRT
jgi:fucose permease